MHGFEEDSELDLDALEGDESASEQYVWQWLLRLNPGDPEQAAQQLRAFQERTAGVELDGDALGEALAEVIDWQSGFQIEVGDSRSLVEVIDELSARWHLSLDWDGDPSEDDFYAEHEASSLLTRAYDELASHGYSLWLWEARAGYYAGGISLRREQEAMRELASLLGIQLRLGHESL